MELSTFTSKIGTNYAATEEETIQLKKHLSERTDKLTKLRDKMDRAYAAYNELLDQHESLSCYIGNHQAFIAPIRHLPVDIFQQIFQHCLPTEYNALMSRHESPLLLTQICSSWRHIAHTTASLWASIHIAIPEEDYGFLDPSPAPQSREAFQKQIVGVKEWLGRSGACALKISIFDREIRGANLEESYRELFDFLISLSHRWAITDFQVSPVHLARIVAMSEHDVPILRSLSTSGLFLNNTNRAVGVKSWKDSGLMRAPRLREIAYTCHVSEDFTAFPLPWSSLTALTLNMVHTRSGDMPINLTKIHDLLRSCSQLVTFDLDALSDPLDTGAGHPEIIDIPPISLPHLRKLSIRSQIEELSLLFSALELPVLQDFAFYSWPSITQNEFASRLLLLLGKISTTLHKLTIDPTILNKAQVFQCLQACPRVTSLCIKEDLHHDLRWCYSPPHRPLHTPDGDFKHFYVDDQLLYDLANLEHGSSTLLPNLTHLECFANGEISDVAIVDFVTAKRSKAIPGIATLNYLAIRLERSQTIPMIEKLESFVEDGLICHLCYRRRLPPQIFRAWSGTSAEFDFLQQIQRIGAGQWKFLEV